MEKSVETICRIRKTMGDNLVILGHHYQSDAVIAHTDIQGDSLELSRKISDLNAQHIVFCGVYFMAESAAILSRPGQKIHIPDTGASCPMADMAEARRVEEVINIIQKNGRKIIPLTYVNSSAAVKGVVGHFDGSVCTSANAKTMLDWAQNQGDAVLFLPDKHLARNTATFLNIPEKEWLILPSDVIDGSPALSVDPAKADGKRLIIWPGYCPIHEKFGLDTITSIHATEPDAKIVVHPECDPKVVQASDGNGSTTYLIDYVAKAPIGSTIYIGTETNLVNRLVGVASLRDILLAKRGSVLKDLIKTQNLITVGYNIDKEEVAHLIARYNLLALPVVDFGNRLLGVVTVDDVIDIIHEEASEDMQAMVGAGADETTDSPWLYSVRVRLPWLIINVLFSAVSAWVVLFFEGNIAEMAVLAVLMPVVANQAGNTGQQALAVMIRQLAMERFDRKRAWLAVLREIRIGLVNGLIISTLVFCAAYFISGKFALASVMGIALGVDMVLGALAGASIPLLLKELGRDPAQASSIFLTTITDSMGFFFLLGLAGIMLLS